MDLNGHHRKWPTSGRKRHLLERILIAFATMCVFSLMMIINMDVYRFNSVSNTDFWADDLNLEDDDNNLKAPVVIRQMAMPAMKTIVAYSPEKQAEMDRRNPFLCNPSLGIPDKIKKEGAWLDIEDAGVSLYSAYYDDRIPNQPYTRILAIASDSFFNEANSLFCQSWTFGDNGVTLESVEASVTQIWWSEWDPLTPNTLTPLLISCALMSNRREIYNTSITTHPCTESSTIIEVKPETQTNYIRNFTVCVKDMNFDVDISKRLVEWFELLQILGAEYFHIYVASLPKKVESILRHYSKKGVASIHQAPRPSAGLLWQRRRDHLLAYNDCLYTNLKKSKYIIPLDIDEIIVPRNFSGWFEMLKVLQTLEDESPGAASLAVSNVFFFDSFESRNVTSERLPHTLNHLRRSSLVSPAPEYSKSFVSTSKALTVFNHYALSSLFGAERARALPENVALLHHYKANCHPALVNCQLYTESNVEDTTLLRFSNDLVKNINQVLNEF